MVVILGTSSLSASACHTFGSSSKAQVCVTLYQTSSPSVYQVTYPGTAIGVQVNAGYAVKVGGGNLFNGRNGWHAFPYQTGNTTAQAYLNSLSGTTRPKFALGAGASLYPFDPAAPKSTELWRNPSGDQESILSTSSIPNGVVNNGTITITPPSSQYFSTISFYWGSVDPWNTVTFTGSDSKADTVTVTGADLSTYLNANVPDNCGIYNGQPGYTGCTGSSTVYNNSNYVVEFQYANFTWQSVSLSACGPTGNPPVNACQPAFEIDNFAYLLTASPTTSFHQFAATPEPSSMLLLGTGMACIAGLLRRKFLS